MKNKNKCHLLFCLPLLLAACSIRPVSLKPAEMQAINNSDQAKIKTEALAVIAPISVEEAIARSLKYNLDQRTRMLEQSLAVAQLDASKFDMLPKLMANAGYSWRDQESTRNSLNPETGTVSSVGYISSDRQHKTYDLGLTWNLLDFGASYFTAKQNADRVLIASERRRKAMHTLIQNVRTAYWRAVAAQKISDEVQSTIKEAESALSDSKAISSGRVKSPVEALRYQRNLLENIRLLESVSRELSSARIELANYMGISPAVHYTLKTPQSFELEPLNLSIDRMEEVALIRNADLRESFYNVRIAKDESKKALLKLLPGISLNYANKHDSDSYLINQQWHEAGMAVGFNLLNLLSGPSQIHASKKGEVVAKSRRLALQMAVITQVHLARYQYEDACQQYKRSKDIYSVDYQLSRMSLSQEKSKMASRLDRIAADVNHILSSVRYYQSIAKVNEAAGKVQATLGLEPEIGSLDDLSLEELSGNIAKSLDAWVSDSERIAQISESISQNVTSDPEVKDPVPVAACGTIRRFLHLCRNEPLESSKAIVNEPGNSDAARDEILSK